MPSPPPTQSAASGSPPSTQRRARPGPVLRGVTESVIVPALLPASSALALSASLVGGLSDGGLSDGGLSDGGLATDSGRRPAGLSSVRAACSACLLHAENRMIAPR